MRSTTSAAPYAGICSTVPRDRLACIGRYADANAKAEASKHMQNSEEIRDAEVKPHMYFQSGPTENDPLTRVGAYPIPQKNKAPAKNVRVSPFV